MKKLKKIDGVINCAGIATVMKLMSKNKNYKLSSDVFFKTFQINV